MDETLKWILTAVLLTIVGGVVWQFLNEFTKDDNRGRKAPAVEME